MDKIIRNMAMCKQCKDVIESESTHDFKMCTCGAIGVDGGHEYLRRTGSPSDILEMSILEAKDGHFYFYDEELTIGDWLAACFKSEEEDKKSNIQWLYNGVPIESVNGVVDEETLKEKKEE